MSKKVRGVKATSQGIHKIRERMGCLQRKDAPPKGKSCWTNEYLAQQANVSVDTVKRTLKGVTVDISNVVSILNALGLHWEDVVKELEAEELGTEDLNTEDI